MEQESFKLRTPNKDDVKKYINFLEDPEVSVWLEDEVQSINDPISIENMTKRNIRKPTTKISMEKEYAIAFLKIMDKRAEQLMDMQQNLLQLNQDLFHEKWKFRYVSRRLKEVAPDEVISEDELIEKIKGAAN